MSKDHNHVSIIGRTTRDIELKYLQSGTAVASFAIANNDQYMSNGEKKESVSFFNVVAFGKQAETLSKYVTKGHRLLIEGRINQRRWQDKDGQPKSVIEINLSGFQFLEGKGGGRESESEGDAASGNILTSGTVQDDAESFEEQSPHFSDDDIPF